MQRQNLKAGKILYVGLHKPIFIAFISINFTERKSRMEKPVLKALGAKADLSLFAFAFLCLSFTSSLLVLDCALPTLPWLYRA